jgi:uncharacterized protein (TIGR02996 family)
MIRRHQEPGMSERQAFEDALMRVPTDDTARLVYADWLDEHDFHREAEYLRLVVSLVNVCDQDDPPEGRDLRKLAAAISPEWCESVSRRFATLLYSYEPPQKINVVKHIREATGLGLHDAKVMSEALPSRVVEGAAYERAVAVRTLIQRVPTAIVHVHPTELPQSALPFRTLCRVMAGFSHWGDRTQLPRAGQAAFRRFVQQEKNVSATEADDLCQRGLVVLTDGLSASEAIARLNELRQRLPTPSLPSRPHTNWNIYLFTTPSEVVRNDVTLTA